MKTSFKTISYFVVSTIVAVTFSLTGCSKDINIDSRKNTTVNMSSIYTISMDKSEIDSIAREIGIAHNYELFTLYKNANIAEMSVTELCEYVNSRLIEDNNKMGLETLPGYIKIADSMDVMEDVFFYTGELINNKDSVYNIPRRVDQALIMQTMEEYYNFVKNTFLGSDTYDEFESACMNRLQELCDSTSTIDNYYYMSVCGNLTFSSFCAWATIFSGVDNDAKSVGEKIRDAYNAIKAGVLNTVESVKNWVTADVRGGFWGGIAASPFAAGVAVTNPYAGAAVFTTGIVVGGITGSVHYANHH